MKDIFEWLDSRNIRYRDKELLQEALIQLEDTGK